MTEIPSILFIDAEIGTHTKMYQSCYVFVDQGVIQEVGSMVHFDRAKYPEHTLQIALPSGWILVPGMIDVHIHGANGSDVMDATPQALQAIAQVLPQEGVTSFVATTMTQSKEAIALAVQNAGEYIRSNQPKGYAECLGIHLEGPFLSPRKTGAQPSQYVIPPDIQLFQSWQDKAQKTIRIVTLAPEEPNALKFIQYLRSTGVVASLGHTDASYQQAIPAIEAGASHVTHLFNGMRGLHHREPGVAAAALLRDELMVELIVDGIHICPEIVKLSYQHISSKRGILISDAIRAKCLHSGIYELAGQEVHVQEQEARLADGTLAGSVLRMNEAWRHFREYTNCTFPELIEMSSVNPARELQLWDRKGSIEVGKDADLVLLSVEGEVQLTLCRGVIAFDTVGFSKDINCTKLLFNE